MLGRENQEVDPDEWEWRKSFYGFEPDDEIRLKGVRQAAGDFVHDVVAELYEILERYPETNRLLREPTMLKRLKESQSRYFLELFDGDYGEEYLRARLKIGRVHHHIGLELEWYLGAYTHYYRLVHPRIMAALAPDTDNSLATLASLHKLITLDQSLAVSAYMVAKDNLVEQQTDEIKHLSSRIDSQT